MIKKMLFLILSFPVLIFSSTSQPVDVIALADLFADYCIFVSEKDLQKLHLTKGSWNPVSEETWHEYLAFLNKPTEHRVGGSGMNVLKALNNLHLNCACFGKRGSDKAGDEIQMSLMQSGIISHLQALPSPTSKVLCLITDDGERTMVTSIQNYASHPTYFLDASLFEEGKLLHIEGFQIPNFAFVEEACKLAKENNLLISLDLGSANLLSCYKESFAYFLSNYVDILFCNAREAAALTGESPKKAVLTLHQQGPIVVVTNGKEGGWVAYDNHIDSYNALPSDVIDTTGAGDFFAAGFLYAYLQGYALITCTRTGAKLASHVIQYVGADLSPMMWTLSAVEIDDILMQSLVVR